MTTAANVYCTVNDMQDVLSASGVTLRSDDAPPSLYGASIARAGNQIDFHLNRTYDPADLATSDLVKDWAAVIACFYLCTRRGNPPAVGIDILYQGVMADLKEVQAGRNDIPGIARRKGYAPALSVMRATMRPFNRAVVERSRGTHAVGEPANYHQSVDPWDAYGWNANSFLDNAF